MVMLNLLTELKGRGVVLSVQDGKLISNGPKGAITLDLGAAIKAQKAALLLALQGQAVAFGTCSDWVMIGAQPGHCGSCALWKANPEELFMGVCHARADAFWPEPAPLFIHIGHGCVANKGKGYTLKQADTQPPSDPLH